MKRARRAGLMLGAVALVCFLCLSSLTHASQVRLLSVEELSGRSGRVFAGKVVDVRVATDPRLRQPVTQVTFQVERGVKGSAAGRLTIKVLGDQRATPEKGRGIEGAPRYAAGDDMVLFLYPEGRSGLTSAVGFGQGQFRVVTDKLGHRWAINGFRNQSLFRNLTPRARRRLGEAARWQDENGIPPEALLDLVARLQK